MFMKFTTLKVVNSGSPDSWTFPAEPHLERRRRILEKHPEIVTLMGHDPFVALIVFLKVAVQLFMFYLVRDLSWGRLLVVTYFISATLNHSLGSAIHEIGHNLAFGAAYPMPNRILGFFCNLPMGIPISISYKKYHADHHRYMGHKDLDADVPLAIETILFRKPLTRILWLIIHPIIHGVRPFVKVPYPPQVLEIVNIIIQVVFDIFVLYFLGTKTLFYSIGGTLLGLGFHPLAGHFISEHYMFTKGQATCSYYGMGNLLTMNVGYHVEHHDFPTIPGSRLPLVKKIAPEFYDNLAHHSSWLVVLWKFIFDEGMGPQGHGVGYLKSDLGHTEDELGHSEDKLGHTEDKLGHSEDKLGHREDKLGRRAVGA